jgi:hypothetical protein
LEPIAEWGKGQGRLYGVACGPYGQVYDGRGLLLLTWLAKSRNAGRITP